MPEQSAEQLFYSDNLITNLQLRWGGGFLSPGGSKELALMLEGVDIEGRTGLDFGCGIGGYDVLLVREHGAAKVVGIDIEQPVLERARGRAEMEELTHSLEFLKVEPGPLPFDDASFDFVFSKDSIVHLPNKPEVFGEFFRVVRPGGRLVISDWFRSEEPFTEEMRRWATEGDETFEMDTLAGAAQYAVQAGFVDMDMVDRNDWFRAYTRDEYERLKGPLFATYVAHFGEDAARTSVENARIRALLAGQGQLRPGHLRATRP